MARIADEVIVVSESLAKHLPQRSYTVIPSGLDLERFRPMSRAEARQQLGLPLDKTLLLFPSSPANAVKRFGLARAAVDALKRHDVELVTVAAVPHRVDAALHERL